ncbi:hypothetical protein T492DRAFT_48687 [Pavlovales sp. CCMP2436]|nr:hypothetical protein T492DRAFT_48687 [Pavlovales sp. CCMP2436]
MYLLLALHTVDAEYRQGHQRPQTFRWIAISVVVYSCDRLYKNLSAGWARPGASHILVEVTAEHFTIDVRRYPNPLFFITHVKSLANVCDWNTHTHTHIYIYIYIYIYVCVCV